MKKKTLTLTVKTDRPSPLDPDQYRLDGEFIGVLRAAGGGTFKRRVRGKAAVSR